MEIKFSENKDGFKIYIITNYYRFSLEGVS